MKRSYLVLILILLTLSIPGASATVAQSNTIDVTGTVEAANDGSITLNGLSINLSNVDTSLAAQLVTGATIHITGTLENGIVIAISIEILSTPEPVDTPSIKLEKAVSVDGGSTWQEADATPGPQVGPDMPVSFRLRVINDGNTELSEITLEDTSNDVTACTLPAVLTPGAMTDCIIGPFDAADGLHTNVAAVTAIYNELTVTDSDSASYFGGEPDDTEDLPVTIVIEGPVQQINVNIITIYNINIEINQNDPILPAIQIGDEIRVEGNVANQGTTIIIVAVNITIINVDIVIGDDDTVIWRDSGTCSNPPPPWAPANGWRRRCENNNGNQDDDRGKGKKKDKDDDD